MSEIVSVWVGDGEGVLIILRPQFAETPIWCWLPAIRTDGVACILKNVHLGPDLVVDVSDLSLDFWFSEVVEDGDGLLDDCEGFLDVGFCI